MKKFVLAFGLVMGMMQLGVAEGGGAPLSKPLFIMVGTDQGQPIIFTLDSKRSCTQKSDWSKTVTCVFSTDCKAFPNQQCVQVPIRPGKHLMKAAPPGDWSVSKWVDPVSEVDKTKPVIEIVQCFFSESMGNARYFLKCDRSQK